MSKEMLNNDWKTRHVRIPSWSSADGWERGGITLLYKLGEGILSYKYSICNPKDQYSRKIGIAIAEFGKVRGISNELDGSDTSSSIVTNILLDIVVTDRSILSKETLELVHSFIRTRMLRELSKVFYPKNKVANSFV